MSRHYVQNFPGNIPMHLQNAEAPRLQERSVIARIAFCSLAIFCCSGLGVSIFFVYNFVVSLQQPMPFALKQQAQQAQQPPPQPQQAAAAYVNVVGGRQRRPPIQRSVIQRLAMLKKQSGRPHEIDVDVVGTMFPTWVDKRDGRKMLKEQEVLSGLILAVSYLSQELIDD